EYALIAALVGVAAIVALTTLGTDIKTKFNSIGNSIAAS
ncbi:MAG: Flp family type IVb pilin, partial [Betaproteobacteria bacterium]|nr:Flp family type IVb pilin [Betaproteobacteria bacterium]